MRRIFALLDSRVLTRVGNLRTLFSVAAMIGVIVVLMVVNVVASAGRWWPVIVASAVWLTLLLIIFVSWRRSLVPRPALEPLTPHQLIDQLTGMRDRVRELALSPQVEGWTYEQCRDFADEKEREASQAIHALGPPYGDHWDRNRRMYHPDRPPGSMQAHFRDRMRYTGDQLDKVIADLRADETDG